MASPLFLAPSHRFTVACREHLLPVFEMCGRYSITLPPEAIRQIFRTHGELPNWPAYYALR